MKTDNRSFIPLLSGIVNVLFWVAVIGAGILVLAGIALAVVGPTDAAVNSYLSWESPGLNISFPSSPGVSASSLLMTEIFLAMTVVIVALGIFLLSQLRAVIANFRDGSFFASDIPPRLSRMGSVVILAGILNGVFRTVAAWYIVSKVEVAGVSMTVKPGFDWMLIFIGFVLFVLAEVFRRGSDLQEDHDLTV